MNSLNPTFQPPPAAVEVPPAVDYTCEYYISIDRVECGEPAEAIVQLGAGKGSIALCTVHKATHDRAQAAIRLRRQGKL